jgi:hypothetical protein
MLVYASLGGPGKGCIPVRHGWRDTRPSSRPRHQAKTLSSLTGLGKREAVRANDHHRILRMGIGD